jgi:hypothetical protein
MQNHELVTLNQVRIASPCEANWDKMRGDDRVRYCPSCEKNVYNLSALSAKDAKALIVEREGKLCARFYERADGTMLTADCPSGFAKARRRVLQALTFVAVLPAWAQNTRSAIEGRVQDRTGAPLTGARVRLMRGDAVIDSTLSDDDGKFSFPSVQPGTFELQIQAPGFRTFRKDVASGLSPRVVVVAVLEVGSVGGLAYLEPGINDRSRSFLRRLFHG